jgi:hypothetical protein
MLPDTPACSQLSLFHDSALPVNWIHQVRTEERGGVRNGTGGRIRAVDDEVPRHGCH